MASGNGNHGPGTEALTAQVAAAERFARALIVAFGALEELRVPLTDVQKIAFVEAALLEFDGFEAQLGSLEAVAEVLRALRGRPDEN